MKAELDLTKEASMGKGKDKVMHWVREAYRRKQWNKWLTDKRRAVEETDREPYDKKKCKRARAWAGTEVQKVILTGGLMTLAAAREAGKGG